MVSGALIISFSVNSVFNSSIVISSSVARSSVDFEVIKTIFATVVFGT
jgi:hypothetical protein